MARVRLLDSDEVRRAYLTCGGNVRETAHHLQTSRETIYAHLQRVNPLVVPSVRITTAPGTSPEDVEAIAAYVRACLDRAGIRQQ